MSEEDIKYCPKCGASVENGISTCPNCKQYITFPKELKKFNWGAFLMNWIWGIIHGKYVTLWFFPANIIPILGPLVLCIWLGVKGNEWAWNTKNWDDIEEFNKSQKFWVKLWFILAILGTIIFIKTWIFLVILGSLES